MTRIVLRLESPEGFAPAPANVVADGAKAKLPPDLIALEQKMRSLHINSERGTLVETVTGASLDGKGFLEAISSKPSHREGKRRGRRGKRAKTVITTHMKQSIPLLTADFETSVSPKLAVVRGELFGAISFQERVIGEQIYMRSPLSPVVKGSRPWLYISPAEQAEQKAKRESEGGSSPKSVVPGLESTESGFGRMIEMLAHSRSVVEVGPREVDGQQTVEFEADLYPQQLFGKSRSKISKAAKKAVGRSGLKLDLYLAPDGLPVRTRLQTILGKVDLSVVADILATEVPVSVQAPPASETITEPELEKLQENESGSEVKHLTKREREEARRFGLCMSKHFSKHHKHLSERQFNKIAQECERISKRGSR